MPRASSKVLSAAEKRSHVAGLRKAVKDAKAPMKGLRADVTAAKKALRAAESAVKKQQRVVDAAAKAVAKATGK